MFEDEHGNPVAPDPSDGGVAVPSTLKPGTTAYLRYFLYDDPQNELDKKFIESLYDLDKIGELSYASLFLKDLYVDRYLRSIYHDSSHDSSQDRSKNEYCIISHYLRKSIHNYSSLFIISGTNSYDAKLHSVITFYCEKVGNKPTLVIDAFCSNQREKKTVDNHGGRLLFEVINRACKKSKIKQIDLEAVDEAIPWYLSKGFVHNLNKNKNENGLTDMKKRVSWSSRTPWSSSPMKPVKKTLKVVKVPRKKPARKTSKNVKKPRSKPVKKTSKSTS